MKWNTTIIFALLAESVVETGVDKYSEPILRRSQMKKRYVVEMAPALAKALKESGVRVGRLNLQEQDEVKSARKIDGSIRVTTDANKNYTRQTINKIKVALEDKYGERLMFDTFGHDGKSNYADFIIL